MPETTKKPDVIKEIVEPIKLEEPVKVDVVKISTELPGLAPGSPSPIPGGPLGPIDHSKQTSESVSRSLPTEAVNKEITLKTENQRQINLIWESTQQKIAFFSIGVAIIVAAALCFVGNDQGNKTAAFVFLTGVANLITGFYFGRTNHQRTGGVGAAGESGR